MSKIEKNTFTAFSEFAKYIDINAKDVLVVECQKNGDHITDLKDECKKLTNVVIIQNNNQIVSIGKTLLKEFDHNI